MAARKVFHGLILQFPGHLVEGDTEERMLAAQVDVARCASVVSMYRGRGVPNFTKMGATTFRAS